MLTVKDDFSIKHVAFRCPDGAALLTYAGAGRVTSAGVDVHVSDWIRQFIRGESYTVDQTLIQIREHATRDLGALLLRHGVKHMFSVGASLGGIPWVVQIRNFSLTREHGEGPVERAFQTVAQRVPDGAAWWLISSNAVLTYGRAVTRRLSRSQIYLAK
jgi:hypothetical protein